MFGTVQSDEVREGTDASQPLIARRDTTMPAVFEVLQELNDARSRKINHAKLISGFMRLARDGANEKAKRVSVTALGIESQIAHADHIFEKETPYPGTEKTGISQGPPFQSVLFEAHAGLLQELWSH